MFNTWDTIHLVQKMRFITIGDKKKLQYYKRLQVSKYFAELGQNICLLNAAT